MEGIFFLHSITLLLGAAFALAALPETRNKSLTELEQIFAKKEGRAIGRKVPRVTSYGSQSVSPVGMDRGT